MIPDFDEHGNLAPGIHRASWTEVCARFGTTQHRRNLLAGLKTALDALKAAGCSLVYLNGSFVTAMERPNDYDVCWDVTGVDPDRLDPILIDVEWTRTQMRQKYLGDVLPNLPRLPKRNLLHFFQHDRDGREKGIIAIDLRTLP